MPFPREGARLSSAAMSEFLLEVEAGVATVTLNRPKKKNALTLPLLTGLAAALEGLKEDENARVLVITGAGNSFCSGADLVENASVMQQGEQAARDGMALFHRALRAIWGFPGPSLALVSGDAVGFGMDLALACDLRLAGKSARFGHRFARIALVPDGGSSLTLPQLVGYSRAMELSLLGDMVSGDDAARLGLANRVVEDDQLPGEGRALAARLAKGPPLAYRLTKRNYQRSLGCSMEEALGNEADAQIACLGSQDLMAGVMAWMSGQEPTFTGR